MFNCRSIDTLCTLAYFNVYDRISSRNITNNKLSLKIQVKKMKGMLFLLIQGVKATKGGFSAAIIRSLKSEAVERMDGGAGK